MEIWQIRVVVVIGVYFALLAGAANEQRGIRWFQNKVKK